MSCRSLSLFINPRNTPWILPVVYRGTCVSQLTEPSAELLVICLVFCSPSTTMNEYNKRRSFVCFSRKIQVNGSCIFALSRAVTTCESLNAHLFYVCEKKCRAPRQPTVEGDLYTTLPEILKQRSCYHKLSRIIISNSMSIHYSRIFTFFRAPLKIQLIVIVLFFMKMYLISLDYAVMRTSERKRCIRVEAIPDYANRTS